MATLHDLLQQAKAAGVLGSLVQEVHDGDEGFELVSQAMTDASKRRMDGPPEGYPEDSRATENLAIPLWDVSFSYNTQGREFA